MTIKRLTRADNKAVKDINALLAQLTTSKRRITKPALKQLLKDSNTHLFVVSDKNRIVGMGSLVLIRIPSGLEARIEDVVVDERYRGQGLGMKIMRALLRQARKSKVSDLELTSKPSRVAANRLYQKLGFTQKETNVYEMKL